MLFDNSVLIYTGNTRSASKILKDQKNNYNSNLLKLNLLKNISEKFLKLNNKNLTLENFSNLLNKNWEIKKKLSKKINSRKIEKIINLCYKNNALAVKLLGAGGGGFIFSLIKKKNINSLKKKMNKYEFVNLRFEPKGSLITLEEKK